MDANRKEAELGYYLREEALVLSPLERPSPVAIVESNLSPRCYDSTFSICTECPQ